MYDFISSEKKWQDKWNNLKIGEVDYDSSKPKFFLIWAYLTVSGFHHVGHMRGYSYADAICRYKRMNGYNVLLPAGGHATGNGTISKAYNIKNKDPQTIEYYKELGLSEADLEQISTPFGFIDFFKNIYIKDYKSYGFIGDWRRFVVTTDKEYNKFIEWQFKKLKQKNMLLQKPYFATACVDCGPVAVDPSEMDLKKGGNAQKNEYTILKLKFEKDNQYVVVATLRPETIFGQTNIWLDYNVNYVKIKIGNEIWIASKEFADKLKYQKDNIEILDEIKGKDLVGKYVTPPIINRDIIILPSDFCDPNIGTGIVTSVPSDAPADWIALFDLQRSKELTEKYGLDFEEIKKIEPIAIINSKGFGKFPAIEICKKYNINSQKDILKLEDAKKEVYKKGFHTGVMLDNAGKYSNLKVEQAKDEIKNDLIKINLADVFYDLSEEVVCRCGKPVVIKRIDNQWFIRYSDKELTKNTINHIKDMLLLPEQYKNNLPNILNWFDDRACARQGNWLGTKFPFDKSYTIEPISDSTLYPIFYLVSLYVNQGLVKEEQLTESFFDFVYLGIGDSNIVSKEINLDLELLLKIRKDVEYWYPLDINLGGQDHLTVHFPVFLMNHVALLPKNYWPEGIIVNWWVINKSGKISKSKGGVRSIGQEAKTYSVDAIRLFYANVASPFVNIDFPEEDLKKYKQRLEKLYYFIVDLENNFKLIETKNLNNIDRWLESKFNQRLRNIVNSMEKIEFKEATDDIYFNIYNDLHWYLRRGGNNKTLLKEIIKKWILSFGIFTPHLAEELNEVIGNLELIALSKFPKVNASKIDEDLDINEKNIENISSEIRTVLKMANIEKPKTIKIIISKSWKYGLYKDLKSELEITRNVGQIISTLMSKHLDYKSEIGKMVPRLLKQPSLLENIISQDVDFNFFKDILLFLESEFTTKIEIYKAEDFNDIKSETATPGKPGIIVE